MKTALTSGSGTNAAISGVYQAGKTGTPNYADDELTKLTNPITAPGIVTPFCRLHFSIQCRLCMDWLFKLAYTSSDDGVRLQLIPIGL